MLQNRLQGDYLVCKYTKAEGKWPETMCSCLLAGVVLTILYEMNPVPGLPQWSSQFMLEKTEQCSITASLELAQIPSI